jgi:hypothetical protein
MAITRPVRVDPDAHGDAAVQETGLAAWFAESTDLFYTRLHRGSAIASAAIGASLFDQARKS